MILRRYLLREIGLNFLGVSLLFGLMFLSSTFIRFLTETLEGDYPASIFFTLFILKGVGNLVFIFPLSFFIGVMLAFGRLYKDSEMVVFTACGVRPRQIIQAVAIPTVIVALVVGFLALWFAPWAESHSEHLLDRASTRTEIEGIIPGQFNEFGDDGPVVYVESYDSRSKLLSDVFVSSASGDGHYQLTANRAYEQSDATSGERYLVLLDGYRYEGTPGDPQYRIIHFVEHGILIKERAPTLATRHRYAYPVSRLLASRDPMDKAELQWRLAMPVSVILLGFLAVPLSKTSPRRGRFGGLFLGIMIYVIYNNLLTVARNALNKGEVSPYLGLWWVHALLFLMFMLIMWRQYRLPGPRKETPV